MTAGTEGPWWGRRGGGRGGGCPYGSSDCGGVDGQITRDTWSTRTRKRCFQVWLYWRSTRTFTQWWERKEQKEVEDGMRIYCNSCLKRGGKVEGEKWLWMANPVCRIHTGNMMDSHEYCINTARDHPRGRGPVDEMEMHLAAKKSRAACDKLYQTKK